MITISQVIIAECCQWVCSNFYEQFDQRVMIRYCILHNMCYFWLILSPHCFLYAMQNPNTRATDFCTVVNACSFYMLMIDADVNYFLHFSHRRFCFIYNL